MSESALWGMAVVAFLLPYGIWYYSHVESIEIRKKLYPGNPQVQRADTRATLVGRVWASAFALLLVLWAMDRKPVPSFVLSAGVFTIGLAAALLLRFKLDIRARKTRATVAAIALWLLAVAAWYAVFGRRSGFEASEVLALATLPPVLALTGVFLYGWVRKGAP